MDFSKYFSLTATNFHELFNVAPSEIIMIYGRKVVKNNITAETDPILADVKNVDTI